MRQSYPVAPSRDPPKSENADAYTTPIGCCPLGGQTLKAERRWLFCQGDRNIISGSGLWQLTGNSHETKFDRLLLTDGFVRSRPLPNRKGKTCLLHCA